MQSTVAAEPIRVFLVGMSEAFVRSLARYLSSEPRVALTGAAPSLALAAILLPASTFDLALLDWSVFSGSSLPAVQALRRSVHDPRIVCVADDRDAYLGTALQAGADAVISKHGFASEFNSLLPVLFPGRIA